MLGFICKCKGDTAQYSTFTWKRMKSASSPVTSFRLEVTHSICVRSARRLFHKFQLSTCTNIFTVLVSHLFLSNKNIIRNINLNLTNNPRQGYSIILLCWSATMQLCSFIFAFNVPQCSHVGHKALKVILLLLAAAENFS